MKTWIIRILITLIIFVAITIGGLNLLGGTSETHKKGLENAIGGALRGKANFETLHKFSIFPQFSINLDNLQVQDVLEKGRINADKVDFSFNFIDLLLENRKINTLTIKNLKIEKNIFSNKEFFLDILTINKTTETSLSHLFLTGLYGNQNLTIKVNMEQSNTLPISFKFSQENPFTMILGKTTVTGNFTPSAQDKLSLKNLHLSRNGRSCTTLPQQNRFSMLSMTTHIFSEISESDQENTDINTLCSNIKKYGL